MNTTYGRGRQDLLRSALRPPPPLREPQDSLSGPCQLLRPRPGAAPRTATRPPPRMAQQRGLAALDRRRRGSPPPLDHQRVGRLTEVIPVRRVESVPEHASSVPWPDGAARLSAASRTPQAGPGGQRRSPDARTALRHAPGARGNARPPDASWFVSQTRSPCSGRIQLPLGVRSRQSAARRLEGLRWPASGVAEPSRLIAGATSTRAHERWTRADHFTFRRFAPTAAAPASSNATNHAGQVRGRSPSRAARRGGAAGFGFRLTGQSIVRDIPHHE
jgi:hypothetical protein